MQNYLTGGLIAAQKHHTMLSIFAITTQQATAAMPSLILLLQDAVGSGASIGFLPPLTHDEAERYWRSVVAAMADGSRILMAAQHDDGRVVGAVQLDLCTRANGLHRAEVSKLMVHTSTRRHGIGHALMMILDGEARKHNLTTLVLDTRAGDPSERLYQSTGWVRVGEIPYYARSANGDLHATALYYKLLA